MTADQAAGLVSGIGMLVLVGSSLLSRGVRVVQGIRYAAAWVGIFGVILLGVSQRDALGSLWDRIAAEIDPARGIVSGGTVRVPMSDDGHFWVRGTVNGVATRFLIDSGATTTALSAATAAAAGIAGEPATSTQIDTANGPVQAVRTIVDHLEVGPIERDRFAVVTAAAFGDQDVLGMNFLSSLHSWSVHGRWLVLEA